MTLKIEGQKIAFSQIFLKTGLFIFRSMFFNQIIHVLRS